MVDADSSSSSVQWDCFVGFLPFILDQTCSVPSVSVCLSHFLEGQIDLHLVSFLSLNKKKKKRKEREKWEGENSRNKLN